MNKLADIPVGGKHPVRIMGIINTSPESFYKKTIVSKKQAISSLVRKIPKVFQSNFSQKLIGFLSKTDSLNQTFKVHFSVKKASV